MAITFDLGARDMLLLYFFTGIGLNARLSDLLTGGRPFLVLLALTVVFINIANALAIGFFVRCLLELARRRLDQPR